MASNYDTILINHDGTLFEADQVRFPAFLSALLDFKKIHNIQIPLPSKETIKNHIGLNINDFFQSLIPEHQHEHLNVVMDFTLHHEIENIKKGFGKLYDGTIDTLKKLKEKNYRLALYSLSHPDYFNSLAQKYKYHDFFDFTISSGICPNCNKNHIVETCINKLNAKKTLLVGDVNSDILAGIENHCDTVAVLYGYGKKSQFSQAKHQIKNFSQILKLS